MVINRHTVCRIPVSLWCDFVRMKVKKYEIKETRAQQIAVTRENTKSLFIRFRSLYGERTA